MYNNKEFHESVVRSINQEKIRQNNEFVYVNARDREEAKSAAEACISDDKKLLEYARKSGTIYPAWELVTDYKPDFKRRARDFKYHLKALNRCPVAGLVIEDIPDHVLINGKPAMIQRMYISNKQPDLGGEVHWTDHGFHFTRKYHPKDLDMLWKEDFPEGSFLDDYGICDAIREEIKKGREHELYVRKFNHYIKYWELWGFDAWEFGYTMSNWNAEVEAAKKAERFLQKCLDEGHKLPFPYYDKSKDEYWKYRTPNSVEMAFEERLADAKKKREIYYGLRSEFTDAEPFRNSREFIDALAGDDWRSQETRERILTTFPSLNKQIISPDAPEYKTRMNLVDEIIRMHPKYAPGHDGYDRNYFLAHPDQGVQEWAWRLGALMNAFGPSDPVEAQNIVTRLTFCINKNAVREILDSNCLNYRHPTVLDKNGLNYGRPIDFEVKVAEMLEQYNTIDPESYIKDASLTWMDVQFAAIYSLLHCDNVVAFYGAIYAIKNSSIMYASPEERDRYLKVMELNHQTLYDDGQPLFTERNQVRLSNLKRIQDAFISYKDNTIMSDNESRNELHFGSYIFWNPMTVSFKTKNKIGCSVETDLHEEEVDYIEYETNEFGQKESLLKKKKVNVQSYYRNVNVRFCTPHVHFQQIGDYEYAINRSYYRPVGRPTKDHLFLSHSNVYAANPKYYDLAAATRPENNISITVFFTNDSLNDVNGIALQNRALLTIDFNDYSKENIESPVSDKNRFYNMVPNADMNEILSWIPELKARNIDFSITDTGLLTLYDTWSSTPTGSTNVIEFLERHPELLIDHYFNHPGIYGLEISYHSKDSEYPGLYCIHGLNANYENGSYRVLARIGKNHQLDPLNNGVSAIDPEFLEMFNGYTLKNHVTMDQIKPVQQRALSRLEEQKHYNIFAEPAPEPVFNHPEQTVNENITSEPEPVQTVTKERTPLQETSISTNDIEPESETENR